MSKAKNVIAKMRDVNESEIIKTDISTFSEDQLKGIMTQAISAAGLPSNDLKLSQLKVEVNTSRRPYVRLTIPADIKDQGLFSKVLTRVDVVGVFNNYDSNPEGFYGTLELRYESINGGENGLSIGVVSFDKDAKITKFMKR